MERWVALAGYDRIDLEPLALEELPPHLRLRPGNGLDHCDSISAEAGDGRTIVLYVDAARKHSSGELAVYIDDGRERFMDGGAPNAIVVRSDMQGYGFERVGKTYERVPHVETEVLLDCNQLPEGTRGVTIGWTWRGIDYPVGVLERCPGQTHWTIVLPVDAEYLWWSTDVSSPLKHGRGRAEPFRVGSNELHVP